MIQFLNPIWAWGLLAAVGVPVLAHLLSQKGGQLAGFPTVRFIEKAAADCAKWLRPRHWLLLAIRALLLLLIALAFMKPIWHRTTPAVDPQSGILTAIIIDCSASMTRTEGGSSLFENARKRAIDTLRQLDPQHDRATVIVLDRTPGSLLPEPTASFSQLIARIEALEPSYERGDMEAALRMAAAGTSYSAQLAGGADSTVLRSAFIEVFSDMQNTQLQTLLRAMPPLENTTLRAHRFGPAAEKNLAIFGASVSPVRPVVGQMATISVQVANFSDEYVPVTVEMSYAGLTRSQSLQVRPFGTSTATFPVVPTALGVQHASLKLQNHRDALPADDATGAIFEVVQARPVALLTQADVADPGSAAFYVARALRPEPVDDAEPDAQASLRLSGVALAIWRSGQLVAGLDSANRQLPMFIAIVQAGALSRNDLSALRRYLESGGSVLWMIDSPEAAQSLAQFNALDGENASLAPIVPDRSNRWRVNANLGLGAVAFEDELLSVFEGPARNAVQNIRLRSVVAGTLPPAAQVLWTFEDGTPALATRWLGHGRLAVLAADISPASSDLVKGPVLVPLLHEMLRGLGPGIPLETRTYPGEQPILTLPGEWQAGDLQLQSMHDQPIRMIVQGGTSRSTAVQLQGLTAPGPVTVLHKDTAQPLGMVQVEIDVAESDLRTADAEQLALLQREDVSSPADMANENAGQPELLRATGIELWPWLMAAACLVAICEPLVLLLIGGSGVRVPTHAKESDNLY